MCEAFAQNSCSATAALMARFCNADQQATVRVLAACPHAGPGAGGGAPAAAAGSDDLLDEVLARVGFHCDNRKRDKEGGVGEKVEQDAVFADPAHDLPPAVLEVLLEAVRLVVVRRGVRRRVIIVCHRSVARGLRRAARACIRLRRHARPVETGCRRGAWLRVRFGRDSRVAPPYSVRRTQHSPAQQNLRRTCVLQPKLVKQTVRWEKKIS